MWRAAVATTAMVLTYQCVIDFAVRLTIGKGVAMSAAGCLTEKDDRFS
jgi:hypothetical protein